ncbi:MAG: DUF982 domain-containing protein [Mesorhizobium sp.]|nr:MAG: DUF982 domain-containing protein [Mesorhizobium sp.]
MRFDAIDFLNEWPEDRRDSTYEALLGRVTTHIGRTFVSAACNAFVDFAKRAAILEDPTSAMQWIAARKAGSGKVQA